MKSTTCRACKTGQLTTFLKLGDVPPVNAFLEAAEIPREKKYPLNLAYCTDCMLVQLEEIVDPNELFCNYLHLSAGSPSNINHLKNVSDVLQKKLNLTSSTKILEIGSNDGTLLANFKKITPHVLGVDPAKNLVPLCEEKGVESLPIFFNTTTAADLLKTRGKYDVIVGLNVIPHTPDVVDLLKGVHMLLTDNGVLVMEGAYALETILRGEFDTIYHEHVYSFSLHSLITTFKQANLEVIDVEKIPTQGGSLRIFARRKESRPLQAASVQELLGKEKAAGLTESAIYDNVNQKVVSFKETFTRLVGEAKAKHGKLIGLGAPARGVVILNYCGITPQDIDFIIDDTPLKQGRYAPGVHIPIKSWAALENSIFKNQDHTFVLLSWNYRDHILPKLKQYVTRGTVLIPFPTIEQQSLG